ncbi:MAG: GNAT family N-acetyltransferase [Deltaproteobacteria bacterium]|nr:GNAT family N-acetyltransferase [Deltaproteobacteria bacterium]
MRRDDPDPASQRSNHQATNGHATSHHATNGHRNGRPSLPTLAVRQMELEDLPGVFALGERLFTAEKWPNLYRTWDEFEVIELFATDSDTCLVAEVDGRIAGFALGTLIEKRRSAWTYGYLLWLGVDPDVGRKGVGARLVARLTDLFIEGGARMILVDTDAENAPALSFFRGQGFGNESAHVFLTRNLSQHPGYLRRKRSHRVGARALPKPKPPAAAD